jgi:DNA polymerase I-like protein with 3'-5' exonuclease and polymerase domains
MVVAGMELAELIGKLKEVLTSEGKSIPELCRILEEKDQYKLMEAIAELENSGFAILDGYYRIYREDGGAIYQAKYSRKTANISDRAAIIVPASAPI